MSEEKTKFPATDENSRARTPYAIHCLGIWDLPEAGNHGLVYLTEEEYDRQMSNPDATWRCPLCRYEADWDDDNYEEFYN
jgi:hypothetical protein